LSLFNELKRSNVFRVTILLCIFNCTLLGCSANEVYVSAEASSIKLFAVSSMVKVMPDIPLKPSKYRESVKIAVAGGETEAGQVIIVPGTKALHDVEFAMSELEGPGDAVLPESTVTVAVMGYVLTKQIEGQVYKVERVGWFPDPILPFIERFDVDMGKNQGLWLSINVPAGQRSGLYRGQVTVTASNAEVQTIPVEVHVFDFDIPKERSLPTMLVTFEDHFSRIYGDTWDREMYWRYVDFLHAHRVNMDNFYREGEEPPTIADVERLLAGGQDSWALRYVRQPGEGGSGRGADPATYDGYIAAAIAEAKAAYEVFKQAGAAELTSIYLFDEVPEEQFDALRSTAQRIRKALPGVPVLTSAYDPDFGITSGVSDFMDVWLVGTHFYDKPEYRANIKKARANGDKVAWYNAIWPHTPYANFFVEYEAIETRLLMGAMSRKYRPDAYGYWATNWWWHNETPVTKGPYTDWNPFTGMSHGDGSLFYPGEEGPITSIRFENFRDGLEDYEYYHLLEKEVAAAKARGVPAAELSSAEALLTVPEEIVNSLVDFTRDERLVEQHRLRMAEAIENLQS
jgi:hypothetical protein